MGIGVHCAGVTGESGVTLAVLTSLSWSCWTSNKLILDQKSTTVEKWAPRPRRSRAARAWSAGAAPPADCRKSYRTSTGCLPLGPAGPPPPGVRSGARAGSSSTASRTVVLRRLAGGRSTLAGTGGSARCRRASATEEGCLSAGGVPGAALTLSLPARHLRAPVPRRGCRPAGGASRLPVRAEPPRRGRSAPAPQSVGAPAEARRRRCGFVVTPGRVGGALPAAVASLPRPAVAPLVCAPAGCPVAAAA